MNNWQILDVLAENVKRTGRVELSDKDGQVQLVAGALGDRDGCAAFVEETKKDPMWQTKYYGVSYWFKGITDNDIIDRVTITKKAFREIIKLLPVRVFKVIHSFLLIYGAEGGLKSKCLKQEEFCPACQELIRAGLKFAKEDLVYCLAMFLQFSLTYRFYLQDTLGEISQSDFLKSPIKEIWRLRKLALERKISLSRGKLNFITWITILACIFYRKQAKEFVFLLDIDKIRLDEADRYFCLRRSSYNFWGKELYQRLVEAEIIDEKMGNLILGI